MNNWDKVEKKKKLTYTKTDELFDYMKLAIIVLIALGYLYMLYS